MRTTLLGKEDRPKHYLAMTEGTQAGVRTEGSSSDCTDIAQQARREVEAYVMNNNLPDFTEFEQKKWKAPQGQNRLKGW